MKDISKFIKQKEIKMSMTLREDKSILIEEYSLADFVLAIQKTVQAGYEISLENTNYPQGL